MSRLENILSALRQRSAFVHVVASGSGTLLQHELWKTPGSSSWLSGASFPYDTEETNEFLGFKSEGVNHNTAVQLACKAYMKAYRFDRKFPIGLGMTTSIASIMLHRGDHRIHACIITPDKCLTTDVILSKATGEIAREIDNIKCNEVGFNLLESALELASHETVETVNDLLNRIMQRPVFLANGTRDHRLPSHVALMPGAYNPPHEGHFGIADLVNEKHMFRVVHHVTIDSPHKPSLTAQQVLERAKLLRGRDAIFTQGDALYLDKAKRFPNIPLIIGVDALDRMFDPKWGVPTNELILKLQELNAKFYVNARPINGIVETCESILQKHNLLQHLNHTFVSLGTQYWDISSTEIRQNATLPRG